MRYQITSSSISLKNHYYVLSCRKYGFRATPFIIQELKCKLETCSFLSFLQQFYYISLLLFSVLLPQGFELIVPLAFTQLISLKSGLRSEVLSLSTLISYAQKLKPLQFHRMITNLSFLPRIVRLSLTSIKEEERVQNSYQNERGRRLKKRKTFS